MKKITKIEHKDKKEKKIKVVAYVRVSTSSEEQKLSFDMQKIHYEKMLKENPLYDYQGIYYDEGISGTKKDNRSGLLKMLEDAKKRCFDLIMTKSISRFARNTTECLEMIRSLMEIGVAIFFEKENIHTQKMEGELMVSILASLAESESKSISENSKWSIQKRFKDGSYVIGTPPYGYQNINGEMVINDEEAKVIKEIFSMYLSGNGGYLIAKELNRRNIPTRKNRQWISNTIIDLLKNEKYMGACLFQKNFTNSEFKQKKNKGEMEQYLVKNHHEAIITEKEFLRVQEIMKERRKSYTKSESDYNRRYVFSSKIICGHCHSIFKRRIHKKISGDYIAWGCTTHIYKKENCPMKFIKEDDVKFAFLIMMNKLAKFKNEILLPFQEDLNSVNKKDALREILEIEQNLEEITVRQARLTKVFVEGLLDAPIYNEEKIKLHDQEQTLLLKKEALLRLEEGVASHREDLQELLDILNKNKEFHAFDDGVVSNVVENIEVLNQTTYIFHLKCGLNLKEEV